MGICNSSMFIYSWIQMDEYQRKLPKSALAFYIKVYCKKREETKVKVQTF